MARMARSQTNYRGATGGLAGVKTQSFAQEVPQIQSQGAGLDPFRGDLTNAFNQFFGSVSQSIGTFQDAHFQNQKIEAQEYAVDMKKQATVSATDYYMENPKSRDVGEALSTTSPEQQGNKHFVDTFKSSLGANIGSRMYSDFALAQAQRAPSTFEANASQYWRDNYQDGTDDPTVNMAIQTAWASNYETQRVTAAQETVRRQKAASDLEYRRSIYNKMAQPEITAATFNSILRGGTSRAGETTGQLQARNLGIMVNAAMTGRMSQNGIAKFIAHMNHSAGPIDAGGENIPSIAQKFPIMSAKAETSLMDAVQRNTTMAGQQAFSQMSSDFNTQLSNTQDEYAKLALIGNRGSAVVAKMQNTPGISMTQIAAFKKDLNTERSKLAEYHFNQVAMNNVANGLPPSLSYDPKENKGAALDWLNRNAPMGVEGASVKAGAFVKNLTQTYGAGNFPENVKQQFASQLTSGDPAQQTYALEALMIADPTGRMAGDMLPKDDHIARLGATAAMIEMNNGASAQGAAIKVFNPSFQEAIQQIDKDGLGNILAPDATNNTEREAAVAEMFTADEIGNLIEQNKLGKWAVTSWFSSAVSGVDLETQGRLRQAAKVFVALQRSQDKTFSNHDVQVAALEAVSPQMWVQGGLVRSGRQATNVVGGVVMGKSVMNPQTGDMEDTIATFENDLQNINDGAFSILGQTGLNTVPDRTRRDNSQIVTSDTTGLPINLEIGSTFEVDSRYHPDGRERGFLSNSTNWSYDLNLTGDITVDRAEARKIFGPAVTLERVSGDNSYQLIVSPRFVGKPQFTDADIERLGLTPRETPTMRYGDGGSKPFYLFR